ncbi:MAG: ABC transporter ATP-binding protein [Betaproteobacteria bacterium]
MKINEMLGLGPGSADYLLRLVRFSLRQHPVILVNLGLALLSVLIELAAMASLMPLSLIAAGEQIRSDSSWTRFFSLVGVTPTFSSALVFFVAAFSFRLITQFMNQATSVFIGKRVQADLSSRAFERIVKDLSLRDIDAKSAGPFISLAGDETARAGSVVIAVNQLVATGLLAVVYLAAIAYFSYWLAIGVVVFLILVFVSLRGTLRKSQTLSVRQLEEAKMAHSVFLDALNGLRSVRALSAEAFVTSKYGWIIRNYTRTNFFIDTLAFGAKLIPALILLVSIGAATVAGFLSPGSAPALALLVTSLAFLLRFFPAAGQVLSLFMRLSNDLRAASDVTHLLDAPPAIRHAPNYRRLGDKVESIELRDVSFSYLPGRPVIRNFSATLLRGNSYAFVGASGSGKSTLFDLLLGFYLPDSGKLLVNGIPTDEIDSHNLRSHVVLVGQQVTILNDTIANNIKFGADASEAEVRVAGAAVCIDSYVEELPKGYETILSYQGSNLSGGQRQRIGLARALIRNRNVLLLDESTSALDAETRNKVVENILHLYREKIVVFSTHDESVANQMDIVIEVKQFNADRHEV